MAKTVLKTKLPYNHTIAIESPCNGSSIAAYARIVKVDEGLNSSIASISSIDRVGMEGSIYLGNTPQYKTMTISIDISDDRILWDDFYSFFNKENLYKICLDDTYYIDAAISSINNPLFSHSDIAIITFECATPYWERTLEIELGPYTMNYTASIGIDLVDIGSAFYGQYFEPTIELTIGSIPENKLDGVVLTPYSSAVSGKVNVEWMSGLVTVNGGIVTISPCSSNQMQFISGSRTLIIRNSDLPDKSQKLCWGETYLFSLKQSALMTATETTLKISGKGRYYN